jgi:hypothetical protein
MEKVETCGKKVEKSRLKCFIRLRQWTNVEKSASSQHGYKLHMLIDSAGFKFKKVT